MVSQTKTWVGAGITRNTIEDQRMFSLSEWVPAPVTSSSGPLPPTSCRDSSGPPGPGDVSEKRPHQGYRRMFFAVSKTRCHLRMLLSRWWGPTIFSDTSSSIVHLAHRRRQKIMWPVVWLTQGIILIFSLFQLYHFQALWVCTEMWSP